MKIIKKTLLAGVFACAGYAIFKVWTDEKIRESIENALNEAYWNLSEKFEALTLNTDDSDFDDYDADNSESHACVTEDDIQRELEVLKSLLHSSNDLANKLKDKGKKAVKDFISAVNDETDINIDQEYNVKYIKPEELNDNLGANDSDTDRDNVDLEDATENTEDMDYDNFETQANELDSKDKENIFGKDKK